MFIFCDEGCLYANCLFYTPTFSRKCLLFKVLGERISIHQQRLKEDGLPDKKMVIFS